MAWSSESNDDPAASASTPRPIRRKAFRARLETIRDVQNQIARLYREARSGTIDVQDASRLANVLAILGRMIGESEFEARIAALEAKAAQ
jgi:hypothetical protein